MPALLSVTMTNALPKLLVQQNATLTLKDGTLALRLEKQEIGRSHRFSRFYGSRRILKISIPQSILTDRNHRLIDYFADNAFVIFGRVFRAFFAKEGRVYLIETNENHNRIPSADPVDSTRLSLLDFINWHNSVDANGHQVITNASLDIVLST
jgi:RNA-dependent RNA polymerase